MGNIDRLEKTPHGIKTNHHVNVQESFYGLHL